MASLKDRLARLEAFLPSNDPIIRQRWFCDVRFGHTDEDTAAGFMAAGIEAGEHDIVRAIIHLPHQWPEGHRPFVSPAYPLERSSCRS